MDSLNEHNVYQIQPGHVLNEDDGEPCKDTITVGLHSLTCGTKNPLSKYNEAFCLLQQRRKIIPVSTQAKSTPSHVPNDTVEVETQMDTSTDISSHGQQEPQSKDNPFIDSIQEDDSIQEEEVITEVARIIKDLENGIVDPTLARLGAEDVALDMDDIFVCEDDNWSDSSSEGSVDGVEEEEWATYVVENVRFQWIFTKSHVTKRDLTKSEPLLPAITWRCSAEFEK